jgi:hypothetical protein
MSFKMIALEVGGKRLFAIADKRMGRGVCNRAGKMLHWEHVHDNCLKLQPVTDTVFMYGGCISDMSDEFYAKLLTQKHLKPSKLLAFAESIDREVKPMFWKHTFNEMFICGVYDDGQLFIWTGKSDGSNDLTFSNERTTILDMGGGLNPDTSDLALHMFGKQLLANPGNYELSMKRTLLYAASIDKAISPTYDFIMLESEELVEHCMLTSQSGKRVALTAAQNNIQVFNDAEQVLIEVDDDSALEGSYESSAPPFVDIDGKYPKNYLGSRNNPNGSFTYFYATMGPGISVGVSPTDVNGFSTLGRKEIFTNGKIRVANASGSEQTEITKTGITTTGNATIGGSLDVKGDLKVDGNTGFTGYELVSSQGPQTRKYVKGIYMGIGPNGSW